MKKALELDETWEEGTLLEFFVSYEAARPGGTEAGAKAFLDRAQKLNEGHHLGVQVSWAEGVLVQSQKRDEFEAVLKAVIAADVDAVAVKKNRLANTIAQRRAKLLLKYASDLFN